ELVAPSLEDNGQVLTPPAPGPPMTVLGHEVLLRQALGNLLHNASRYAGLGARVSLSVTREGDAVRLVVADNGPGVPDALQRDVFLPFFTTRAEGTGVGLNLVRQIAIAHGGSVGVEDRAEGGALFRLRW
ncbi:MAG: ATP-binding protein, partial [Sphingomonas sp.]